MSIEALAKALPPYARDLAANLIQLAGETAMSEPQKWGAFLASAYAVGSGTVIRELEDGLRLSEDAAGAAKAAAAIMNMNNVYYRALHVMKDREYSALPAKLRMSAVGHPGAPKADFELWCVAVSAINGCGACLDSHEHELRTRGVGAPVVQAALRIGAVVNAVSRVLLAEEAAAAAREASEAPEAG